MKVKGRPKATGKFASHAELIENVKRLSSTRNISLASIARICQVSRPVVVEILESQTARRRLPPAPPGSGAMLGV